MSYLARYYEKEKEPFDFAFELQVDHKGVITNLHHVGSKTPLESQLVEKLTPKIQIALTNFRNRMENVMSLPCNVEIYAQI